MTSLVRADISLVCNLNQLMFAINTSQEIRMKNIRI